MKTAIYECHYHEEFLHTLIQLYDHPDVYTTKSIYDALPSESKDKATFYFRRATQSPKNFISSIDTSQYDYFFVNTIQPSLFDLPDWKSFTPKCKTILTLHNLNAWHNNKFIPRLNLLWSLDSYLASKVKSKILRKFDYLNAVYYPVSMMLLNYFPFTHNKFLNIPYSLAQENFIEESKETIDFVVPGVVDCNRRDYDSILKHEGDMFTDYNLRFILLGKNKEELEFSKNVVTFDERVPTDEYNNYLRNADMVICPSVKTTHTINAVEEEYGLTKAPNVFDSVKWRKPLMMPSYVNLDERLRSSTLQYNNFQSFYKQVIYLMEDLDKLKALKQKALKNTKHFTKEAVKKNLDKLLP